jgi:hypothetical protein
MSGIGPNGAGVDSDWTNFDPAVLRNELAMMFLDSAGLYLAAILRILEANLARVGAEMRRHGVAMRRGAPAMRNGVAAVRRIDPEGMRGHPALARERSEIMFHRPDIS